nr:Chain A, TRANSCRIPTIONAL FACTOR SWI5 [Saccharomyces cerevisiae]
TLPRGSIDKYVKEMPDKTFECLFPGCTKTFKRRYNIRSHIQTHLEDR